MKNKSVKNNKKRKYRGNGKNLIQKKIPGGNGKNGKLHILHNTHKDKIISGCPVCDGAVLQEDAGDFKVVVNGNKLYRCFACCRRYVRVNRSFVGIFNNGINIFSKKQRSGTSVVPIGSIN